MGESQISDVGEAIPVAAIPVALISWATQTALVSPENTAGGGGGRQWSKHQIYSIFVSVCEPGRGEGDQIAVTAECPRGQCGTVSCRRVTSTFPFLLLLPPTTGWRRSWWVQPLLQAHAAEEPQLLWFPRMPFCRLHALFHPWISTCSPMWQYNAIL